VAWPNPQSQYAAKKEYQVATYTKLESLKSEAQTPQYLNYSESNSWCRESNMSIVVPTSSKFLFIGVWGDRVYAASTLTGRTGISGSIYDINLKISAELCLLSFKILIDKYIRLKL
jgi:hypothetical protein